MEQLSTILALPNETWLNLLSFFNKRDLARMSLVSKACFNLSKDKSLNSLPVPELDYSRLFEKNNVQIRSGFYRSNSRYTQRGMGTWSIAVFPDGSFITGTGFGLKLWHKKQHTPDKLFFDSSNRKGPQTIIYVSPIFQIRLLSATQFITCGLYGSVCLWDIAHPEPIRKFEGHDDEEPVYNVLVTKANQLITASGDKTLRIWDRSTGNCLKVLEGHTQNITYLAEFPGNIIVSASDNGDVEDIESIENTDDEETPNIDAEDEAANENKPDLAIRIWNLHADNFTLTPVKLLEGHTKPIRAFCQLNNTLLATAAADATIRIWDIKKEICVKCIILPDSEKLPTCLTLISPSLLACGTKVQEGEQADIYLYQIDVEIPILLKQLSGHKTNVNTILNLSNDSFASVDKGGEIKLWSLKTKTCIQTLSALAEFSDQTKNEIMVLAKLPNGYLISPNFYRDIINIWAFPELGCQPEAHYVPKP